MEEITEYIFWIFIALIILQLLAWIGKRIITRLKENRLLKRMAKAGITEIDGMDGFQFETYLKALMKELGYKSEVTKQSNDFGADLIMKKDGKRIAIQAKRYGFKNRVGIDAVQQVYAAQTYYKASESWVMTNSTFTKSAIKLANGCNVKLYDRQQLVDFINQVNPSTSAAEIASTIEPSTRKCPSCSGELIQRRSKTGNRFMGCSNFPHCKHTESIAEPKK